MAAGKSAGLRIFDFIWYQKSMIKLGVVVFVIGGVKVGSGSMKGSAGAEKPSFKTLLPNPTC